MSRHDDSVPMRHMLDHAREAGAMVRQRSRADLHGNRVLQLALGQIIQIIGEAANRVSKEGQAGQPHSTARESVARGGLPLGRPAPPSGSSTTGAAPRTGRSAGSSSASSKRWKPAGDMLP
jgi:hypothetical protein